MIQTSYVIHVYPIFYKYKNLIFCSGLNLPHFYNSQSDESNLKKVFKLFIY